jgi:hypothetical protein
VFRGLNLLPRRKVCRDAEVRNRPVMPTGGVVGIGTENAKQLFDGHAVEVWEFGRFIGRLR